MQNLKIYLLIVCTLFVSVFNLVSSPAIAQEDESAYLKWLQKYGAWDAAQREIGKTSLNPEDLLERASLLLRLHEPEKALELLEQYGVFSSKELEARRLWLKARGFRLVGDHIQSLLLYSKAGELFSDKQFQQRLNNEPQLENYWQNVWLYWFWENFSGTRIIAEQGQKQLMNQAVNQALMAWPEDYIWEFARQAWRLAKWDSHSSFKDKSLFTEKKISSRDQGLILQALSALALDQYSTARDFINNLSYSHLKSFWQAFLSRTKQDAQAEPEKDTSIFPKSASFFKVNAHLFHDLNTDSWQLIQPDQSFWTSFTENLKPLTAKKALDRIKNELNSSLLPPRVEKALLELAFAHCLLAKDWDLARKFWNDLELDKLPLSLKLAGIVLFEQDPGTCFTQEAKNLKEQTLLSELANAAGYNIAPLYNCPFWTQIPGDKLAQAHKLWPLDKLLNYSFLSTNWQKEPSEPLAKHLALLYPDSAEGQKALLFLARAAHKSGKTNIAWKYVNKVDTEDLSKETYTAFLAAKAGLQMDLDQQEQSLRTYQKLINTAPDYLPAVKRLKLALLAQRQGQWEWAHKQLDTLWQNRNELSDKLQAETLFWLAEGAQHKGDLQEALDHYLRVAWKYPEEHIWAVTAMYRAALIYEQRGRLQTATELLKTVIKRADRDSQKEAARDRIKGIENKLGDRKKSDKDDWSFLF